MSEKQQERQAEDRELTDEELGDVSGSAETTKHPSKVIVPD